MAGNNLGSTYGPILQGIANGIGVVKLTPEEENRMRELIVELKKIYDIATKRMAKSAK